VSYIIEFRPAARRELKNIPIENLRRIIRKIDALADNPRPTGVEKLSGSEGFYRIRVGDTRILYEIMDRVLLILIIRIRHRREACRN
jgi:mRNA interferase RelE/StbE